MEEYTEKELEVMETMLELQNLVVKVGCSLSWGRKKNRRWTPVKEAHEPSLLPNSSSSSFATLPSDNSMAPTHQIEKKKDVVVEKQEAAVSSPSTTLSLFPSDYSDGNSGTDKNKPFFSLAKIKGDSRLMGFIHLNAIVQRELMKATQLGKPEDNIFLEARKVLVIKDGTVKIKEKRQVTVLGAGDNSSQQQKTAKPIPVIDESNKLMPRESINELNRRVTETGPSKNENEKGPRFPFDLNARAPLLIEEESSPPQCSNTYLLDEVSVRRATTAQARQRRMRIFREKKNNNK